MVPNAEIFYGERCYLCNTPYATEVKLVEEGNEYIFSPL